jgi:hypothetical protein
VVVVVFDVGSAAVAFAGAQSHTKARLPSITGASGGGFGGLGPRITPAGAEAGAGGVMGDHLVVIENEKYLYSSSECDSE